MSEGHCLVNQR